MLRNDISYSSIAPTTGRTDSYFCCFCTFHCSHCKSCCRSCFLRLPYGSITSAILAICGLIISFVSILEMTTIADRWSHDLIRRKYYWFSDLKVMYIVATIFIVIIICINLLIGFVTTGASTRKKGKSFCGCGSASATNCLNKTVFVINYILFYLLVLFTIIVLISLFIFYVLTNLCNFGAHMIVNPINAQSPFPTDLRPGQSSQYIDLRQFSPLLSLRSNETQFLYLEGDRLKKFCKDYVSVLWFKTILCSVGMVLLCSAFLNFLINLSVNRVRISAKQKYTEIMYLNGAEMTAFNEGSARY